MGINFASRKNLLDVGYFRYVIRKARLSLTSLVVPASSQSLCFLHSSLIALTRLLNMVTALTSFIKH